ncbi:MAG: hypothetical protein EXS37_00590 [Opitutus sp.]|nr:hypothetical protein [Opitutus sp.]
MAKPSPESKPLPRLLVLELWGIGDLALAMPFLRAAVGHSRVTLLAKPHAAPLLARFAPEIELVPLIAPWTAFRGKYRLHRWPWRELTRTVRTLRNLRADFGVSARRDPRDHLLLALAGARRRIGFPRNGSGGLLSEGKPLPKRPHRAEHWRALAESLGWSLLESSPTARPGRRIVIHTGAGHAVRRWPAERFAELAARLRAAGRDVVVVDDTLSDLDRLIETLMSADRFIGNDSGPGHLAALLGVPTFTVFGPQLPELFAPQHPSAAWQEGAPCPYKPCFDACRFAEPACLLAIPVEAVWRRVSVWLEN